MKNLKTSIIFKIIAIVIIALTLMIPTAMVKSLIREREIIQQSAISEVSEKWGESQTFTGPFISIPYSEYVKQISEKDSTEKIIKIKKWLHFLPNTLQINGSIAPEKRTRSIYEIVVYESNVKLSGVFSPIDIAKYDIAEQNIDFSKATLNLGISDLKGIEKQIALKWNERSVFFNPGTSTTDIVGSGINCPINVSMNDSLEYAFSMEIDLKGSQLINFVPVGKTTDVTITSNWSNPSFDGEFLPDTHTVDNDGFAASWNILHLNRNYPQSWSGADYYIHDSAFGVNLLLPVDRYQKSMRVIKYAILFLAFTFLVFFFVEVLNQVFIHPVQYILVGTAIVVFYTLLIALSEHITFNLSYLFSAILTLILVTGYVYAILSSKKLAFLILGMLGVLYSFIFTIIQLQDYALLIGSIGVFIILALVMYGSRKIDWYELRLGEKKDNSQP